MSTDRDKLANIAERDGIAVSGHSDGSGASADLSLLGIAERLQDLQFAPDAVLGAAVVDEGACLDETVVSDPRGWLFDDFTDRGTAALVCADCPVRDECLELELRLFGAQRLGMWGPLGEDGRRALHPVWLRSRAPRIGRIGGDR